MNELVKVRSAAQAIGMSQVKLYRAAERGEVPHYRLGRSVRFDISELKDWMKARTKRNTEAVPA